MLLVAGLGIERLRQRLTYFRNISRIMTDETLGFAQPFRGTRFSAKSFRVPRRFICPRVHRAERQRINTGPVSVKSSSDTTGTEASINRIKLPSNPALTPTVNRSKRGISKERLDFLKAGSPVKLSRLERGPGQRAGSGRKEASTGIPPRGKLVGRGKLKSGE